ncbi:MAG: hypothetical protein IRZ07_26390 [Microbispora sp.]|nr:hypothetical protein [Microbispora sp.]
MKLISALRVVAPTAVATALICAATLPADAAAMPKFAKPKVFGTSFQSDPHHNFRRLTPRHDGILRGWVTRYRSGVAVYEPIRWVKDKTGHTEGYFQGAGKSYASRVAKNVVFYSATGCKGVTVTVKTASLGSKRCPRGVLISRMKAGHYPALITVYRGKIVKVQEIFTP